jgi:hypothetical protein
MMFLGGNITIRDVTVSNMGAAGIMLVNDSISTVSKATVTGCGGDPRTETSVGGIVVNGAAITVISYSNVSSNQADGIRCGYGGNVTLSATTTLGNGQNGVLVGPQCRVDLSSPGNARSRTSMKNGLSGLCIQSVKDPTIEAYAASFSCDRADLGACVSGTPVSVVDTATCVAGADYSVRSGVSVTTPWARCCY